MGVFREKVMVFLRHPEPGRVKTRLVGKLSEDEVCRLYRCFVEDTLANLAHGGFDVVIYFDPPGSEVKLAEWLGRAYEYVPQGGASLGERMQCAFAGAFDRKTDRAVLIGTDSPDLDAAIVRRALDRLVTGEAVLGPAADGGYYLIGFPHDRYEPAVFENINWGGPRVFEDTVQRIRKRHLDLHVLPQWHDIDTFEDLKAFYRRAEHRGLNRLKTVEYLRKNLKIIGL